MKNILMAFVFTLIGAGVAVMAVMANRGSADAVFILIGVMIPVMTFIASTLIMRRYKEKVQSQLNISFGENVVKIASAIMDYFQFPLVVILTGVITLFLFTCVVLAIAYLSVFYYAQ